MYVYLEFKLHTGSFNRIMYIRVVFCTLQNIAYGLAFVKFHSPPDKIDPPTSSPVSYLLWCSILIKLITEGQTIIVPPVI